MRVDGHGRFVPCSDRFPGGIDGLADRCHAEGVAFGLHLMRGVPRVAVERALPIEGTGFTCADIADTGDACPWCADNFGVRMDHPAAQPYYDSVLRLVASWGVDLLKVDDVVPYPREIEAFADAIERCGRPMTLSLSPGNELSFEHLPAYRRANALRVTADVWDRRDDLVKGLRAMELWAGQNRPGFWIDLDMVPIGALSVWREREAGEAQPLLHGVGSRRQSRFTEAQKRSFLTQRAMAASPLILGGHLPDTSDADLALMVQPDLLAAQANGVMARVAARGRGWTVFAAAERDREDAGWTAVFNTGAEAVDVELRRDQLGVPGAGTVRDVWGGGDATTLGDTLRVSIDADDVRFLRREPAAP